MREVIGEQVKNLLRTAGVGLPDPELTIPPKPEMGDLAHPCFVYNEKNGNSPADVARHLAVQIAAYLPSDSASFVSEVKAFGPYVNFYLDSHTLAEMVLQEVTLAGEKYGQHTSGNGAKIMVEFAHPNTHKALHIGHLRNIVTGESLVRLLENVGYKVVRANYQGDVGLHIAKCLWGINRRKKEYEQARSESLGERVSFLGKAYAVGSQAYENDQSAQTAVQRLNAQIYARAPAIQDVYQTTRSWSLEYFDSLYRRLGAKFDRLYFESEVYQRGAELVREQVRKGVFEESQGAIIFSGSQCGLHDRVFINSEGFATYEGKEVALAELQFKEHNPDKIIHLTGREQADYFRVVFAAIAQVFPQTSEREQHLTYGWVRLKHGKMSSRTGNVVLAEWLLDEVQKKISAFMVESQAQKQANNLGQNQADRPLQNQTDTVEKISLAAVKYSLLKTGVGNDLAFDLDESVSTSGDSGPYLLYIVARVKSLLRKSGVAASRQAERVASDLTNAALAVPPAKHITDAEKKLLLKLVEFPVVTRQAAEAYDPSVIAVYLFHLAQSFNIFYGACPVLNAADELRHFRLHLCAAVARVMERGLHLLGIDTVEEM